MTTLVSTLPSWLLPLAVKSEPVREGRRQELVRDARLVALARENPREFEHLVRLYERRVYATALRLTGSASEAEDISQETFVRAFRALDRFDVSRPFGPWVCVIAANLARDHLRSPLRRLGLVGLFSGREERAPTRRDPLVVDDARRALEEALQKLSPTLREALVLRFIAELSVDEVASALGIGESAAKMRLKRGLEAMRELLGDETPLDDALVDD